MHPYRDSWITRSLLILFFIVVILYAYFEARGILFGPSINITQSVEEVSSPYVEITGTTSHISQLSMNGTSVPVTESGAFSVPYVLEPGFNELVFDAKDKYGQSTQRVVEIVYTPATSTSSTTPGQASSTQPKIVPPKNATSTTGGSSTGDMAH
jgi:Glucodextranase, domain B